MHSSCAGDAFTSCEGHSSASCQGEHVLHGMMSWFFFTVTAIESEHKYRKSPCELWSMIQFLKAVSQAYYWSAWWGRNGWWEYEEMLLVLQRWQDNACLHIAACTHTSLEQFKWEIFAHPECSPSFVPIDITHPSTWSNFGRPESKEWLWGKVDVPDWLLSLPVTCMNEGIQKLVPWYDKCCSVHGSYVEK